MAEFQWQISPWASLALALLYFYDRHGVVAALLPAALCHELGHLLVLLCCGARIRGFRADLTGLELDYAGILDRRRMLAALAAGPLAGLVYGWAALGAGGLFLRRSGTVSLALSFYNLLPILPLDGGRILSELTEREFADLVSRAAACVFFVLTLFLLAAERTVYPFPAACWLLASNFRRKKGG